MARFFCHTREGTESFKTSAHSSDLDRRRKCNSRLTRKVLLLPQKDCLTSESPRLGRTTLARGEATVRKDTKPPHLTATIQVRTGRTSLLFPPLMQEC